MSHTPGPWIRFSDKGATVSILPAGRPGDICWMSEQEEREGNAILIAAAPELLAALQAVTPPGEDWWCPNCQEALHGSRVTHDERCDTCGTHLGYQNEDWISSARAAIAKATGKDANK